MNCDDSTVDEESEDLVTRILIAPPDTDIADVHEPLHARVRRDIRTYKVKTAGISIKNLDYPGASDLYSPPKGASVKVNVLDFNSDEVADHKVKNTKTKPASYDGYVTEHIVEVKSPHSIHLRVVTILASNCHDIHRDCNSERLKEKAILRDLVEQGA